MANASMTSSLHGSLASGLTNRLSLPSSRDFAPDMLPCGNDAHACARLVLPAVINHINNNRLAPLRITPAHKNHPGITSNARDSISTKATEPTESTEAPVVNSILCKQCDGNGAIVCSQCKGNGINKEDHFNGQFKAGTICWLCRGKREILCGTCNGAGFIGGYLNAFED